MIIINRIVKHTVHVLWQIYQFLLGTHYETYLFIILILTTSFNNRPFTNNLIFLLWSVFYFAHLLFLHTFFFPRYCTDVFCCFIFVIVIIGYIALGTVGEFHTLLLITQSIIMTHNHTTQTWRCARVMICSGLVVACKCELLTYPVLASCTTQNL